MILGLRHKKPFISFGNEATEKQIFQGETATIWLNTLYKDDTYVISITNPDAIKVSNYQYEITPEEKGVYEIRISIESKIKKNPISLKSNLITLTVI